MRIILNIILIAVISFVAAQYFPWWVIAVVAFVILLLLPVRPAMAFVAGFLGVFLLWVILASSINAANSGILAGRIGQLLRVGNSPSLMVFITGLIGGLIGGLAGLSASYLTYRKRVSVRA